MIIDTNSWHYKLLDKLDGYPEYHKSLCPYVRELALRVIVMSLISIFVVGVLSLLLLIQIEFIHTLYSMFVGVDVFDPEWVSLYGKYDTNDAFDILFVGTFITGLECLVAFLIANAIYDGKPVMKIRKVFKRDAKHSEKEPNIFSEYIRAVHNRVCPSIKFEDKS